MQKIKRRKAIATMLALALGAFTLPAMAAIPALQADRAAVTQACAGDAQFAHCPVGPGQMRCLKTFRHGNPGFRVSPACRSAKRQLHADRRALRPPSY